MVGCIICDSMALHLPETEFRFSNSVEATFQRNNYQFSITNLATQGLQREVERLHGIVHKMQEKLADYCMEDHSVGSWTNCNGVFGTNGTEHDVDTDPNEP